MQEIRQARYGFTSAQYLVAAFAASCAVAAIAIGASPLTASIATIFLFAGAHNVMEFRYFVTRMPRRWGHSRSYYLFAMAGVVLLAALYITIYFSSDSWLWSPSTWFAATASWNTAFILWVGTLFYMRGRQRPRSDWSWAFPAALLLAALAWAVPQYWSLALVYLHPFIAMWFLERQIRRTKPEWLRAYHYCLAMIPIFVGALWLYFANAPNLPQDTRLYWRISQHAGSEILPGISSHFLVAAHVFLESIHYFVWILLIPLIDKRAVPWRLSGIPLFSGKDGFPKLVAAALAIGVVVILVLWLGFAVDYSTTRDIYFAFAIGHVMAEFPFLIKML